jgi:hypothetical protein
MAYSKAALLALPAKEKLELADELIDSAIVEKFIEEQEWKKQLIIERVAYHDNNPKNGTDWEDLKKQYGR